MNNWWALASPIALCLLAASASAHHVTSDSLNLDTPLSLDGSIVAVEWANPHVVLHVEVLNEYGAKKLWLVDADTPSALLKNGINRSSFTAGSDVYLEVYLHRVNNCATACLSYGVSILLENGRTFALNDLSGLEL